MDERYVMLRGLNAEGAATILDGGLRLSGPRPGPLGFSPPEVQIDVATLSRREASDVARDPSTLGPVALMPLSLIEPVATTSSTGVDSWGIEAIGASASTYTGAGVIVAVLDTGIESTHPAFEGVEFEQQNFTKSPDVDAHGHGTHCAGTIFGRDVSGRRIGVARGVSSALIGKVLDDFGNGTSDSLFNGLNWAIMRSAQVISMSVGFNFTGMVAAYAQDGLPLDLATSKTLEAYRGNLRVFDSLMSLARARQQFGLGSVVIAASGNDSKRDKKADWVVSASLPAASDGVIAVGAVGQGTSDFTIGSFSNANVVLVAPGVDVVSADRGGGLIAKSGTSMACPHVAGAAVLWWEMIKANGFPQADVVIAKLKSEAQLDVLNQAMNPLDRGSGMVRCP
jgi:subtilisin family serine protease